MAGKHPVSKEQKLLDAASSLKRALGIPNHPTKEDKIDGQCRLIVYTADPQSAELLAEIFHSYTLGRLGRYKSKESIYACYVRNSAKVGSEGDTGNYATVTVGSADIFAARMREIVELYISPNTTRSR